MRPIRRVWAGTVGNRPEQRNVRGGVQRRLRGHWPNVSVQRDTGNQAVHQRLSHQRVCNRNRVSGGPALARRNCSSPVYVQVSAGSGCGPGSERQAARSHTIQQATAGPVWLATNTVVINGAAINGSASVAFVKGNLGTSTVR